MFGKESIIPTIKICWDGAEAECCISVISLVRFCVKRKNFNIQHFNDIQDSRGGRGFYF